MNTSPQNQPPVSPIIVPKPAPKKKIKPLRDDLVRELETAMYNYKMAVFDTNMANAGRGKWYDPSDNLGKCLFAWIKAQRTLHNIYRKYVYVSNDQFYDEKYMSQEKAIRHWINRKLAEDDLFWRDDAPVKDENYFWGQYLRWRYPEQYQHENV